MIVNINNAIKILENSKVATLKSLKQTHALEYNQHKKIFVLP